MKELKPILRTRFKCDFCKKVLAKATTMEKHEKICYYNPDRKCEWCDGSGGSGGSGGWGNDYDEPYEECYACKIAKEVQSALKTKQKEDK